MAFEKGHKSPWKGKTLSLEHRLKLSEAHKKLGDRPPLRLGCEPWNKGLTTISIDKKTYQNIHYFINSRLGKATSCKRCGSDKKVEWANLSHNYLKDFSDWLQLCKACHVNYDYGRIQL